VVPSLLVQGDADDESVNTLANARSETRGGPGDHPLKINDFYDATDHPVVRKVTIGGLGHACSGGHPGGSYTTLPAPKPPA
jgi:hypothetical protein